MQRSNLRDPKALILKTGTLFSRPLFHQQQKLARKKRWKKKMWNWNKVVRVIQLNPIPSLCITLKVLQGEIGREIVLHVANLLLQLPLHSVVGQIYLCSECARCLCVRQGGRESPQAQRRRANHSAHDVVGGGAEAGL